MNTATVLAPLPPYLYGRECAPNEKVWPEEAVRAAQRAAVAHAHGYRGADVAPVVQTVDAVLLGLFGREVKVALMPLAAGEVSGREVLLLPGGLVSLPDDQNSSTALMRLLGQQLGFVPRYIEQVFTVAGRDRGAGGWESSIVHIALHPRDDLQALADAGKVRLATVLPEQALPDNVGYDHANLIGAALGHLSARAAHTSIVANLLPPVFSLSDLHRAFEVVCQRACNPANFRRKILESDALVAAETLHGFGRPAQGYRFGQDVVHFDRSIL